MSSGAFKMTPEQQEFATKNHNLIFGFIRDRKLNQSEYYGILAMQFCKAVVTYDRDFGDGNVPFASYAYLVFDRALKMHLAYLHRKKREHDLDAASLDALRTEAGGEEDEPLNMYNIVKSYDDEEIEYDLLLDNIYKHIKNDEDRFIIKSRIMGYTQDEIAQVLGWGSQTDVSNRLKLIKQYLSDCGVIELGGSLGDRSQEDRS